VLYWVTLANYETGEFLGAAVINKPTAEEAAAAVAELAPNPHQVEARVAPAPKEIRPRPGRPDPIFRNLRHGRLMPREELEELFAE